MMATIGRVGRQEDCARGAGAPDESGVFHRLGADIPAWRTVAASIFRCGCDRVTEDDLA